MTTRRSLEDNLVIDLAQNRALGHLYLELNFVRSQADAAPEINEAEVAADVLHVQRVVGESFSITTPQQLSDETIERLSTIIQERVIVIPYPTAPLQTSAVVVEATPDMSGPHGGRL